MSPDNHIEKHFTASLVVRDIIIGMSDGLTVPFALAAGLSGAFAHSTIIITAGLAEIAAGSISMGIGGYLAAKNEIDHYYSERQREVDEVKNMPEKEREEVAEIFEDYGLKKEETTLILDAFEKNPKGWVDFMMRNELHLEEPDKNRAAKSSTTIACAYIIGGIIPLSPYILIDDPHRAFLLSILCTSLALLIFGYTKAKLIGSRPIVGALRTTTIGGLAAAAAYFVAKLIA